MSNNFTLLREKRNLALAGHARMGYFKNTLEVSDAVNSIVYSYCYRNRRYYARERRQVPRRKRSKFSLDNYSKTLRRDSIQASQKEGIGHHCSNTYYQPSYYFARTIKGEGTS